MNTLNFTFNFNAPVGQNIAHVDRLEAHFDKEMTMQVIDGAVENHPEVSEAPSPWERDGERLPLMARAVEAVQSFFWAQRAWAVVYCVCRDHLEMTDNMSEFERRVADYPLKPKTKPCPESTVRAAFSDNDFMHSPLHRWPEGRAKILAEALIEKLA